jgi:serine/threonine protein kinase/Tfp pilus assembly protein PilF
MTPERHRRIGELFDQALERAPAERAAWLREACGADDELYAAVEKMLSSQDQANDFLARPALDVAAVQVAGQPPASLVGKQFGRYRILSRLGAGGMGEVYCAEDPTLRRKVALKILPPLIGRDPERRRRFEQEAVAASALNHPNIMTIHEFGVDGEMCYLVAELVQGETLRDRLRNGALALPTALDIVKQVTNALEAAHEAGIVHRDIKPENVMIRPDGLVKVLDFGLAKMNELRNVDLGLRIEDHEDSDKNEQQSTLRMQHLTLPGAVMGTPAYMSPEQARGMSIDARTDLWSLGVILFEVLSGKRPFGGKTPVDVIDSVLSAKTPLLSSHAGNIPPELESLVAKALSKDAAGRYQTAAQLRGDLERIQKRIETDDSEARTAFIEPDLVATQKQKVLATDLSDTADEKTRILFRRRRTLLLALVLLAVISAALYFGFFSPRNKQGIDSIAVLPFENTSGNPALTFVSDGVSEALIDRLSQLPQLKVISRNSSFTFRGANQNLREVAKKLDVRAIVMGSVAQVGDELVIRVDVVDAVENAQLTGGQFRRKAGDLLGVQTEVAQITSRNLQLRLTSTQSKRLAENGTENSDAYRFYLSGLVELNGPQDVRSRALDYFEQAVRLDPEFAPAHTEIAWVYWSRANNSGDPQTLMPIAKQATERALSIDPELAKAHVMKALVNEDEFDWPGAESEYRRAIELSPSLDFARNNYAFFLSVMGRQEEALAQLEQQRVRDPIHQRLTLLQKGLVLTQARRFDDALKAYQDAQAAEPARETPNFSLGYAYAGKGAYAEAAAYYRKSVTALGGEEKYSQPLVYLAATYANIPEKRREAQMLLRRIEAMREYTSPALLAMVYAALEENTKAMALLEQAYLKRDPLLRFIGVGYEYDGLRKDPRFEALLKRLGMGA